MKTVFLIARLLLGLLFFVFGLNGFLQFIPMGPMPAGLAGQFAGALVQSHYMAVVSALQLIAGAFLLVNRYVPLALTVLAPVIVNIVLFHAFMAPTGLPLAIAASTLWIVAAYQVRSTFTGLLQARAQAS
jgi:putative oxidoreductase